MAHERDVSPNPWNEIARELDYVPARQGESGDGDHHDIDGEHKGWNRASLSLNTHPLHPFPNVSQTDLMIPSAADRLRLLGACLVCGVGLAVLWVYFPFMLIAIPLDARPGAWLWGTMAASAALLTAGLYVYASAEERRAAESLL